nr:MAG TPA: hypothetical protein [Caudoviricetes sp.]
MSRPTTHDTDPAESAEETEQVEEKATDVEADAAPEEEPEEAPADNAEPEEKPAEESSPEEAAEEAPAEKAEPEKAPTAEEYAALKARLEEAEKALASRTLDDSRTKAVTDAGLAAKYAPLLGDDQDSWQAKVELLNALRESGDESASVPRDPAVDASPDIEETETMEFARALLGV